MKNIIWKRMIYHGKDLGDYYLVSNTGEIKGVKTGKIRKKNISHTGYYFVCISLGSRDIKPCIKIHRAVAETFLKNTENLPDINHKDGNKLNNHVDNLEFCTHQYNILHAYKNELIHEHGKKIICLNTMKVFNKITEAADWCGCKDSTISDYLGYRRDLRKSAGKHPQTGENLKWMYYDEYLYLNAK